MALNKKMNCFVYFPSVILSNLINSQEPIKAIFENELVY